MPGTVRIICSAGFVMRDSIFSGAMPGYSMITDIPGYAVGGISAMGSFVRPMTPKIINPAISI